MSLDKNTKLYKILSHLKKFGSITKLEASNYNEFNLGEAISKLKRRHGIDIETIMIQRPGRQAFAKYTIKN